MNDMWRNLVVSVSVLALSGLSYLAFSEPPLFAFLYLCLITMMALIYVIGTIWSGGVLWAEIAAKKAVREYKPKDTANYSSDIWWPLHDEIESQTDKLKMPGWVFPIFVLLGLYLTGLREVPLLREQFEKPPATANQPHASQPQHKVP